MTEAAEKPTTPMTAQEAAAARYRALGPKVAAIVAIAHDGQRRNAVMQLSILETDLLVSLVAISMPVAQAAADWWTTRLTTDDKVSICLAEARLEQAVFPLLDKETQAKVRRAAQ
ncbi:hypothetical protein sos41_31570 [Alphaproteobacteria bacterium SO-S41]|nr:hypothetical protein sos41_31570 [Alphaproteobacteria bacterium SO-S41]